MTDRGRSLLALAVLAEVGELDERAFDALAAVAAGKRLSRCEVVALAAARDRLGRLIVMAEASKKAH
jgi:hypothetical protein